MSVFYAPSGKASQVTLDVMCKHPEVLRVWVLGIEMLMADHEKTRGAGKVQEAFLLTATRHELWTKVCIELGEE